MLRRTPCLTAFPVRSASRLSKANSRVFSSSLQDPESPQRVAIIGGGLAGLSTAFQLLQKSPEIDVTIFDKASVGTSGASSVAGG
jgi:NADPH-dependent 2,4-dienoyl-CoA reductase/sulfur reductase-like enzyme